MCVSMYSPPPISTPTILRCRCFLPAWARLKPAVYESDNKTTGFGHLRSKATPEFAILDMFGKMVNRPIGLLISDKIYNPKINVYQANGERYISAEETIEHLQRDVAISHAKAIKFKLGGRMSHVETPPDRSARLIP